MSAEILQLLIRIAELERKLDSMFRHGPVHERKKIDGRWFVRLEIGGADDDPFLSPWILYCSPNGGPNGLNVHRVPAKGEQLTMLSPAGDPRQAVAVPLFWSDDHPPPSDDEDAVTITHPKFKLDLKDGVLKIETKGPLSIECQTFSLKGRAEQSAWIVRHHSRRRQVFAKQAWNCRAEPAAQHALAIGGRRGGAVYRGHCSCAHFPLRTDQCRELAGDRTYRRRNHDRGVVALIGGLSCDDSIVRGPYAALRAVTAKRLHTPRPPAA